MAALYGALNGFTAEFVGQGPFFAGSELTLADLTLIPWVGRFYIIERHRGFSLIRTDPKFQGKSALPGLGVQHLILSGGQLGRSMYWTYRRSRGRGPSLNTTNRYIGVTCATRPRVKLPRPLGRVELFHEYIGSPWTFTSFVYMCYGRTRACVNIKSQML